MSIEKRWYVVQVELASETCIQGVRIEGRVYTGDAHSALSALLVHLGPAQNKPALDIRVWREGTKPCADWNDRAQSAG